MYNFKEKCLQTRRDILRMIYNAKSGHPGGALGATEYFIALFSVVMDFHSKIYQKEGKEEKEDLFFLSNGHISAVLYSVLARKGYFAIDELSKFRKINSRLQGHPSVYEKLPGIHIASGSLGQGMSVALGVAQSKQISNDSYLLYSYHGDGELNEGQNWEAILYAGSKKVDNYIATIDYNYKQIDGNTDKVMILGNIKMKFESFGWYVLEETKGNCISSVINILQKAKKKAKKGRPICLLLHTEMGHGVDFMNGSYQWHGKSPTFDELKKALHKLPETIGDYDK